jgi:hypothetical protein
MTTARRVRQGRLQEVAPDCFPLKAAASEDERGFRPRVSPQVCVDKNSVTFGVR